MCIPIKNVNVFENYPYKRFRTTLLLHVEREETNIPASIDVHRVVWCPFIPEEGANTNMDSEVGQLLVLTRGPHAEMWCVPLVNARHGSGPLFPRQVSQGLLQVPTLDSTITDAAFSPDGTALAIASAGGLVSFFQVQYFEKKMYKSA